MSIDLAQRIVIETFTHYMGSISGITIYYVVTVQDENGGIVSTNTFSSPDQVVEFLKTHHWIDF